MEVLHVGDATGTGINAALSQSQLSAVLHY